MATPQAQPPQVSTLTHRSHSALLPPSAISHQQPRVHLCDCNARAFAHTAMRPALGV